MTATVPATAVEKLKGACDAAYAAYKQSCSHSVWEVIKSIHDPDQKYLQANALIDSLVTRWSEVTIDDGFSAANRGAVVVGGKKETSHGHVMVIYPGDKILNGGYQYYWVEGKKNLMMARKTRYPRCMSTSIGSWPGALSCGEKTVWDPWGNDAKFQLVRFWTPKWPLG
jgi:hypothetical protein